ncbi:MAG: hypothetical protein JKX81_03940 [Arenicella sp.]|nr:hypothetical protein [Arenicella sp.]
MNNNWIKGHLTFHQNLPRPNWASIYKYADAHFGNDNLNAVWEDIARKWMHELAASLPSGYRQTETSDFIVLSDQSARYNQTFSDYLQKCRRHLLSTLAGIANDEGYGKHVVIIFGDIDHYYDYVSFYGPQEGTYGLSSGMYLNYGYGHFVFPNIDLHNAEPIAAHEMTHALLNHLQLPTWLDEGLAVNMEAAICGFPSPPLDRQMFDKHQAFWGEDKMQEFWRGDSFSRPDDGPELSYQLARILVTNLAENYDAFVAFANKADRRDSGEAAIEDVFDISLGDMVTNFLGEGEWWPKPETWKG